MNNALFHILKGKTVVFLMYMNMLKTYDIRYNDKFDTTTFLLETKCVVVTSPDCIKMTRNSLSRRHIPTLGFHTLQFDLHT